MVLTLAVGVGPLCLASCSAKDPGVSGAAGSVGLGGPSGSGGAAPNGVGAAATSGAATGGTAGGATTGGTTSGAATGGVANGGTTSGAAAGGAAAGGWAGGRAAGGAATGGSGGATTTAPSGDPVPSEGCSAAMTATPCNTQSAPCKMDVGGTARTFYVQLPDKYDAKHPYPVVFQYHPLGGNGWQGLSMYRIRQGMPEAIYVSPDGLTSGGNQGFPNTNGGDEALTRAMMKDLEGKYCVDKARYYAAGFSYGGSMSYTAACNMSDVFRAIGAMSGAPISGAKCTSKKPDRPVAVWATHGDADTALPITLAQPIIASLVTNNGCTTMSQPVDPSPCVAYQGCTPGYPVVWCVRPGDPHAIPNFAAAAIAKFFMQF